MSNSLELAMIRYQLIRELVYSPGVNPDLFGELIERHLAEIVDKASVRDLHSGGNSRKLREFLIEISDFDLDQHRYLQLIAPIFKGLSVSTDKKFAEVHDNWLPAVYLASDSKKHKAVELETIAEMLSIIVADGSNSINGKFELEVENPMGRPVDSYYRARISCLEVGKFLLAGSLTPEALEFSAPEELHTWLNQVFIPAADRATEIYRS